MKTSLDDAALQLQRAGIVSCKMPNSNMTLSWNCDVPFSTNVVIADDSGNTVFSEYFNSSFGWLNPVPDDINKAIVSAVSVAYSELLEKEATRYNELRKMLGLEQPCQGQ